MVRTSLTWLLLLLASTMLAACCGSVACDCQDSRDDAVYLRFNLRAGTPNALDSAALDTLVLLRQLLPYRDTAAVATVDTIRLIRTGTARADDVVLNNAQPFGQRGTRKLSQYFYRLYLGTPTTAPPAYRLDSIQLQDQLLGDGCCTCNQNLVKRVYLNGNPTPIDLADPSGKDQPVPLILNR